MLTLPKNLISDVGSTVNQAQTALRKKMGPKWTIIAAVLVLGAAVAIWYQVTHKQPKLEKQPVITVETAPATMQVVDRTLQVNGTVWAWDPLLIGAEINGLRLNSVLVEEGDSVKKGQVLATLNSSLLKAALQREEARLRAGRAGFNKSLQPNRPEEISALRAALDQAKAVISQEVANVARAKANYENAKQTWARYATLAQQGAVSQQDADNRKATEEMNEAELNNAKQRLQAAHSAYMQAAQRLKLAEEGGRAEDIEISRANVSEIEANIQNIKSQIEQTVIRAPADGTITKRDAHIGEISSITKPLFSMIRDNRLEVRAQVPEHDLARLSPGQTVTFYNPALQGPVSGTIRQISPQVDQDTRQAMVRIDIPFSRDVLPGMFLSGEAQLSKEPVLTVPAKAVISKDSRSQVFVLENSHAISRPVNTGDRHGDVVEIESGLRQGEPVITTGAGFIKDGDLVRLASDKPRADK